MEIKYDLVVIGGGITGLSTALAWTKIYPGRSALVLEQHSIVGGCVSTFARQGYKFDTVQIIPDISDLLEFFRINIPLKKFEGYYARLFLAEPQTQAAKIIPIPSSNAAFEDLLIRCYPDEEKNIRQFFHYTVALHNELTHLKTEPKWWQIPAILWHCPKIIANSNKTYSQYLERFQFRNRELLEVLDIFSSFSGLSGRRCAALLTAAAMVTTLKGSYRPPGGFVQFPTELRKALEAHGGAVRTNSTVDKILIENGQASGIRLANGTIIQADYVVSTADTKVTFGQMVGYDQLTQANAKYSRKVQEIAMSPSSLAIHLGLDGQLDLSGAGFDCGYNVLTTGGDTHERMFQAWDKGELLLADDCFHLAVIAPCLKTGGKQNLVIHVVPVAADEWIGLQKDDNPAYQRRKQEVADFFIDKVEAYMLPGLRQHIEFLDMATPATYARFIASPTGSNYDMLPVPENFGKNRLPTRTPVKNLFVPKFSHGIWPSLQAGLQVIDMISGGKIMHGNSSYSAGITRR